MCHVGDITSSLSVQYDRVSERQKKLSRILQWKEQAKSRFHDSCQISIGVTAITHYYMKIKKKNPNTFLPHTHVQCRPSLLFSLSLLQCIDAMFVMHLLVSKRKKRRKETHTHRARRRKRNDERDYSACVVHEKFSTTEHEESHSKVSLYVLISSPL